MRSLIPLCGGEDEEEFVAGAFRGDAVEAGGLGEVLYSRATGEGGGGAATVNEGADGEVDFVDEVQFEERGVEFAAAFEEESFDAALFAKPAQGGGEVELAVTEDFDFVGHGAKAAQAGRSGAGGGEDDDGGETMAEDFGGRVNGARAADDDAEVVFGQAALEAETAVFGGSRPEVNGECVGGARAADNGVGGGAEFEHVAAVAEAAEGFEGTTGGCDFAVGGDGGVEKDEGEGRHIRRMVG